MKADINLLPSRFKKRHKSKRINYIIFLPVILFVIIFFIGNSYITGRIESYESKIQKLKTHLDKISKDYSQKKKKKSKVKELNNKITEKKEQYNLAQGLVNKESDISAYFRKISLLIPDRVWLNRIKYSANDSSFLIVGKSFSHGLIKKFVVNLQQSYNFTDSLLLQADSIEQEGNYLVKFRIRSKTEKKEK